MAAIDTESRRVLVVEDDPATNYFCEVLLAEDGYQVGVAESLATARQALDRSDFDLIVLDRSLPDGDGLELLPSGTLPPVLVMTLHKDPEDRVEGFEAGALDYLTKPFHPEELRHRVTRILGTQGEPPRSFGPWSLNEPDTLLLHHSGAEMELTLGEGKLLRALLQAQGRPLNRERLAAVVAQQGEGNPKTVDVLVSRLRHKIEDDPRRPAYLVTIPGRGYRLSGIDAG